MAAISAAAALTLAYLGLESATVPAATIEPERSIPRATIIGVSPRRRLYSGYYGATGWCRLKPPLVGAAADVPRDVGTLGGTLVAMAR
jgi:hypothetical protein